MIDTVKQKPHDLNDADDTLIVVCKNAARATTHIMVIAYDDQIVLAYGYKTLLGFRVFDTEIIPFTEEPELKGIFSKGAWDIRMLINLVEECCE